MNRISRDAYGLKLAAAAASRADCTRRQVGAVIVNDDGDIVATGYNGAPAGEPGCLSDGACPRGQMSYEDAPAGEGYEETRCIAIHAEVNAVIRAGRSRSKGATIYVTDEPCYHCSIVIRAAGIVRVVTPVSFREENAVPQRWIVGPGSRFDADQFNLPLAGNIEVRRPLPWADAKARKAEIDAALRDETPYVEGHLDPGYSATAADVFVAPKYAPVRWKCFTCGDSGSVLSADGVDQELCPDCSTPRVFTADDPEPTGVAAVMDRDGYVWRLREGGWAPAPRVWKAGDEEPIEEGLRLRSADGLTWWRKPSGQWKNDAAWGVDWEAALQYAGELTEVASSGKATQ